MSEHAPSDAATARRSISVSVYSLCMVSRTDITDASLDGSGVIAVLSACQGIVREKDSKLWR